MTWAERPRRFLRFTSVPSLDCERHGHHSEPVTASGTFDGEIWHGAKFLNLRDVLTFTGTVDGKSGTLTIRLIGMASLVNLSVIEWTSGHWEIMTGTGDLANLEGQGTWWGTNNNVEYSGLIQFE